MVNTTSYSYDKTNKLNILFELNHILSYLNQWRSFLQIVLIPSALNGCDYSLVKTMFLAILIQIIEI